jgi:hypothetical protein
VNSYITPEAMNGFPVVHQMEIFEQVKAIGPEGGRKPVHNLESLMNPHRVKLNQGFLKVKRQKIVTTSTNWI